MKRLILPDFEFTPEPPKPIIMNELETRAELERLMSELELNITSLLKGNMTKEQAREDLPEIQARLDKIGQDIKTQSN